MNKIAELRKTKKLSQAALADLAGTTQPQIFKLETGKLQLTKEWSERIAPHLDVSPIDLLFQSENSNEALTTVVNLPVLGVAEAGGWRDISILSQTAPEDADTIPVVTNQKFAHAQQYALKVAGDSMNQKFDDGSFVTCVNWADTGLELKVGMCLHVERRQGDLTEVTIKCYGESMGKRWLEPRSTNPKHKPIEINGDDSTEISIKGLVFGSWKPDDEWLVI